MAVGSLVPVKRHEDLLRALAQVVTAVPGVHLHMVGEGRTGPALTALVRELNLTERVTFHGHVPHHELPAYYRASSFCVLTSAFENHAMVVLEAAACGRLTIGTRVGVVPEFAPEPLCVSPGDVAGLARAISELARNSETRSGVAADLRGRVCRDYDLDRTLGEFVNLYRSCAG